MNRPLFITMSTLVVTIVAYVALAQMTPVDAAAAHGTSFSLENLLVKGR